MGPFPGGKTAGTWCWSPTPSSVEVKGSVQQYLYTPLGLCGLFLCEGKKMTYDIVVWYDNMYIKISISLRMQMLKYIHELRTEENLVLAGTYRHFCNVTRRRAFKRNYQSR